MVPTDESKQVEDLRRGCVGCLTLIGIATAFTACMASCMTLLPSEKNKTPEQQIEEWYSETAFYGCEELLKRQLRDPESYRKASDPVASNDTGTEKTISWEFRAKNGFGGYANKSTATCFVTKANGGNVRVSLLNLE